MKKDHVEPALRALAPVLVTVLGLFAISVHEVLESLVFPSLFGWYASPLSVLVSLAFVAVSAYFAVPLMLKETAEHKVAVAATPRPMTESHRPDEVAQDRGETCRAVVETMGVAALMIEEDGTISLVNGEFEKLSGFSKREIEGVKNGAEFVAPDSREKLHMYHEARKKDPDSVPKTYKAQFMDRSGAARDMLLCVNMIPGTKKSVACVIDIAEFKRTEAALMESEERYRTAIESSNDGVTIVQGDIRVYANQKFLEIFGYDRLDEVIGQPIFPVIHPDERDRITETDRRRESGEPAPSRYEFKGVKKDGTVIYLEVSVAGITYRGEPATLNYIRDITERREAEEQIKLSLKEKEVLLKEVHHRVKNNLQVVSSLLFLQSQTVKDEETRRILEESRNRVKSMAFIHKQLYQSTNVAQIDFSPYVRNLTRNLMESYRMNGNGIALDVHVEDVFLALDIAIPCGLIINELVSNALKHAFLSGSEGQISVDLHREGEKNVLVVSDNGVGLPGEIDILNTETLGLQLVSALVIQIEGRLELVRDKGTVFKISF
jgi:PAS domain S-box-containing protein